MSRRKSKNNVTYSYIAFTFCIIIICALLFLIKAQKMYTNIYFKDTIINDVDCSKLTIDEAEAAIQKKEELYSLEILFNDNDTVNISGSQIDYSIIDLEKELTNIKQQQKGSLSFKGKSYTLNNFTYDKEKLRSVLLGMPQFQQNYLDEEIRYVFNPDSKLFEVPQEFYYLDFNEVFAIIVKAVESQSTSVSLEDCYSIVDNSSDLEKMNSLISSEITYQLPNEETYVLDASILYSWLVQSEDGKYFKDEEIWNQNIENFVKNELAPIANTVDSPKEFKPSGIDTTVSVQAEDYGYLVDTEAEIQMLKEDLEGKHIVNRKPCYQKTPISDKNYGLGESYIEIDLTRQKVWVYVDGYLEIETDCVTGCINKGHETPTGIFTLTYKEKDRVLRGRKLANGRYEYESPVSYWMPFNGGIGLHDATWRSSFGGNIYINDGSHGCINLPFEAAKKLYDLINSEMPIIVYKS